MTDILEEFYKKFNIEPEIVGCTRLELRDECVGDCIDCTHYDEDECYPDIESPSILLKLLCIYNCNCELLKMYIPRNYDTIKNDLLKMMMNEDNISDWLPYYREVRNILI